jgi:imidazole glycerol-phosphate synthase subunit HisH
VNRVVAVLDLETGDLSEFIAALETAGSKVLVTNQRSEILNADALVIYGTGELSSFISAIDKSKTAELVDSRLAGGKAVAGFGAGLHVMFENSLAQWPGVIARLESDSIPKAKMSEVLVAKNSKLFQGIESEQFFFDQTEAVLEFSLQVDPPFVAPMVSYLNQDSSFIAAVENGPLTGIGFYPERSGAAGIALLRNWLGTL